MEVFIQEAKELLRRMASGEITARQYRDALDDAASSAIPFVRPDEIHAFDLRLAQMERQVDLRSSS